MKRLATPPGLLLLFVTLSACYDTRSTRVQLFTPASSGLDCFATADRVFTDAGFAASTEVSGVNRFYSPRTPGTLALGWGIAVAIQGASGDHTGPCSFELEALSPDEGCGMQCPLTPAPGGELKDITQKMARLLDEAFRPKSPG